ncbi:MAG: hypothetical protein ACJAWI_002623, partial [Marinomonas primoryensis]
MTDLHTSVKEAEEITAETAPLNTGTVISIRGSVVDVRFD